MNKSQKMVEDVIKAIDNRVMILNHEQHNYVKNREYARASHTDAMIAGLYVARMLARDEMISQQFKRK